MNRGSAVGVRGGRVWATSVWAAPPYFLSPMIEAILLGMPTDLVCSPSLKSHIRKAHTIVAAQGFKVSLSTFSIYLLLPRTCFVRFTDDPNPVCPLDMVFLNPCEIGRLCVLSVVNSNKPDAV